MSKSIIAEGKTTNEAIEKGLKELNTSKNMVDIKVLENEEKRSFFSILAPRIVKVQLTVKEEKNNNSEKKDKKEIELSVEEQEKAEKNVEKFLKEFLDKVQKDAKYIIEKTPTGLKVNINNENLGFLIGYRGETLYAMQNILSSIASKGIENRVRVILDIEGYKEKREKALEDLAEKLEKTVIKTKKSVTLEPMQAYERKIIHTKLQNSEKVEPRRRVVISLKRK
jgi:spoIIIJ-associated protein